jgi:hypothetical protein
VHLAAFAGADGHARGLALTSESGCNLHACSSILKEMNRENQGPIAGFARMIVLKYDPNAPEEFH